MVILVRLQRETGSCALSSGALRASASPAVERSGREGGRQGRARRCCAEPAYAQWCIVIPEPTAQQPPRQPLSRAAGPDFHRRWRRPAGTAEPLLSQSRSWQDLHQLARAPDVCCWVGRPLPDGHLVARPDSRLHQVCIILPAAEPRRRWRHCENTERTRRRGGGRLCCSSHNFQ